MKTNLIRTAAVVLALGALTACSSTPAPKGELAVAQSTLQRISTSPQVLAHAPVELERARALQSKAEKAMDDKQYTEARRYAELAEAEARVAETKAQAAENAARLSQMQNDLQRAQPTTVVPVAVPVPVAPAR